MRNTLGPPPKKFDESRFVTFVRAAISPVCWPAAKMRRRGEKVNAPFFPLKKEDEEEEKERREIWAWEKQTRAQITILNFF